MADLVAAIAHGMWVTGQVCLLSAVMSLLLGTLVAALRESPVGAWIGDAVVAVLRRVPLALMCFLTAFVLPPLGVDAGFLRVPGLGAVFGQLGPICRTTGSSCSL